MPLAWSDLLSRFSFSYIKRPFSQEGSSPILTYSEPHSQGLRLLLPHLRTLLLFSIYLLYNPKVPDEARSPEEGHYRWSSTTGLEKLERLHSDESTLQGSLSPPVSGPPTQGPSPFPPAMSGESSTAPVEGNPCFSLLFCYIENSC